ncbi:hypothetical protein PTSG_07860 [Salpingoeca rosetta]|uniref:Receptor L-domain domain-containing protein n=1 Tax=Salpingoeca rosetta (strain ATCC 50818 / BSB-021) TaxID=946362 RepID=F2UGJ4_SALR5|nr:uncharacterized protein PTSG_07860 [Salpingoeca rosetta]EGD75744.1 hypothetical protein PTSG_07860 [Salpingoeca rosetta]|eukprot:XP_004991665.1 hypothetical protein PTSG_07860 [Salpingoeca rosetta]
MGAVCMILLLLIATRINSTTTTTTEVAFNANGNISVRPACGYSLFIDGVDVGQTLLHLRDNSARIAGPLQQDTAAANSTASANATRQCSPSESGNRIYMDAAGNLNIVSPRSVYLWSGTNNTFFGDRPLLEQAQLLDTALQAGGANGSAIVRHATVSAPPAAPGHGPDTSSPKRASTGNLFADLDLNMHIVSDNDPASRALVAQMSHCPVRDVVECCCDEFSALRRVTGSVTLSPSTTTLNFGSITSVDGDVLSVTSRSSPGALATVDCGQLQRIGGNFDPSYNVLTAINFRNVTRLGRFRVLSNKLATLHFANIERVDGGLHIGANHLTSLDFGQLTQVNGYFAITFNPQLTTLDMGNIRRTRGMELGYSFKQILWRNMERVDGGLYFGDGDFEQLSFSSITHVGGPIYVQRNSLTTINFGSLQTVTGSIYIYSNNLQAVSFGSLASVGGTIDVHDNPPLAFLDCKGLASCLKASTTLTMTQQCPLPCA